MTVSVMKPAASPPVPNRGSGSSDDGAAAATAPEAAGSADHDLGVYTHPGNCLAGFFRGKALETSWSGGVGA